MRAGFLALPVALVAMVWAAPTPAQLPSRPVYPPQGVMVTLVEVPAFATYREFYAYLAKKRGLPDPASSFAIEQIQSASTVDHLRDSSGALIAVVKIDQPGGRGNYSFFVLREKQTHLALLGEMSGRSYESTTSSGHLEFIVDVGQRARQPLRYQVEGDFLISAADLAALDRNDPVELDIRHAR